MAQANAQQLKELLAGNVVDAAAGLVGCIIARRLPGGGIVRAQVVETEAYHQREPGCHAHRGKTPRNCVMFAPPGLLYVYFTYGMWHCANVVCEDEGVAAAVLLRAAMPLPPHDGSRGGSALRLSGPGLLCKGLMLDRSHSGMNVLSRRGDVWLYRPAGWQLPPLKWTTRIGLSIPDPYKWRCYWDGHQAVSPARTGVLKRKQ